MTYRQKCLKVVPASSFLYITRVRHHSKLRKLSPAGVKRERSHIMGDELMNMGAEGVEEAQAASAEEQAGAQGEQVAEGKDQPEKKYTDEDLDRIIAKKIAAERKRMKQLLEDEQQESEIEKRERDVTRRELMADTKDRLISEGYPSSLAKIMDYSDEESHEQSYDEVTGIFKEALQDVYKSKFAGPVPKAGNSDREINREKLGIAKAFAPPKR